MKGKIITIVILIAFFALSIPIGQIIFNTFGSSAVSYVLGISIGCFFGWLFCLVEDKIKKRVK